MSKWPKKPLIHFLQALESGSRPQGGVGTSTSGVPSLGGEHLTKEGGFDFSGIKYVSEEFFQQMQRGHIRHGDILIVKDGATTGKTAFIAGDFPYKRAAINEHVFLLRAKVDYILPRFLFFFLFGLWGQAQILACYRGAAIGGISRDFVNNVQIPLASLPEQERIVRILDEADQLRRLRAEADRRTADLIPGLFNEMFGESAANPVQPLSNVGEVVSGIAKGRQLNGKATVAVPYLRVANVQAGYLDLSEIKTIEALPDEVHYLSLRRGDVLLTEGGDYDKLGRGALWDHDLENCIHQNHIFRVRPTNKVLDSVFFTAYLQSFKAREYFLRCAKRTTNLASINMTQLRNLPVPIPSIDQQRTFTARVAEIRTMEAEQTKSKKRLDDLFQSLSYRAFQGEL